MTIMPIYEWNPSELRLLHMDVLGSRVIHTREWQAMDTSSSPAHATHEMQDVTVIVPWIPRSVAMLQVKVKPDLPWAEEHFLERVSGIPHNPPPSHLVWPYAVRNNEDHLLSHDLKFDHTYPERFWPKHAGHMGWAPGNDRDHPAFQHRGIRFSYGDLSDVVALLVRNPLTRQAYLPVWFPEDTGASAHKVPYDPTRDGDPSPIRVPCTLGYHFMIRDGKMSCRYYIRSCDLYRHFHNDVYFAGRLVQWVCDQYNATATRFRTVEPDRLIMHIASLHSFVGDAVKVRERMEAYHAEAD